MRLKVLAAGLVISSLLAFLTGCDMLINIISPKPLTTITGKYLAVGNPCTTRPCLPGIVYAVSVDHTYYYLTVEGTWLWVPEGNRSWDGYTPEEGDFVTVTGYVNKRKDISGRPFYEIEVVSLKPV